MKQTLKTATEICDKEASDFAAFGRELTEINDTVNGASGLLERHASMLELTNAKSMAQALAVLVQASTLSSADANRLNALKQSSKTEDTDGEEDMAVMPAAQANFQTLSREHDCCATIKNECSGKEDYVLLQYVRRKQWECQAKP